MTKYKILIISHSFPPNMNVGGMRSFSWAKYWSELGHEITILTSKSRSEFSFTSNFFIAPPTGVNIIEIDNPLFKYFGSIDSPRSDSGEYTSDKSLREYKKKMMRFVKNNLPVVDYYFDWSYKCIQYIKSEEKFFSEFDFVISTANPMSTHAVALYLKKKYNLKWVADFRDLEEQFKINTDIGILRRKYITNFRKKILKKSDLNTTVSDGLKYILLGEMSNNNIVEVIYNGYFDENYNLESETKEEIKWEIVYTGTFYDKEFSIGPLFEAIEMLEKENFKIPQINFYGTDNKNTQEILLNSASINIRNRINFKKSVSNKEVANIQKEAAILLLIDSLDSKGVLLTKSYEYMAVQRPIIAIVNSKGELAEKFLNHKNAYYVGSNPNEIKKFIEKIYNLFFLKQNIKLNFYSPDELSYYSRRSQAKRLLKLMEKL